MITTSHCEPMLFNNASALEWDKNRDGEWNYETNKETIFKKFDDRIRDTKQYDNIYTTGLRGLHDAAMAGSSDPKARARTLEKVIADQRGILEKYKNRSATDIPQIFVPYKEALDIYDAGLKVPEDITLIWPDDNYGYMKRVSNAEERTRNGGSGVYYHASYLGTPHDNLWFSSIAPALMYEELLKCYNSGADRYWLLNVGDIKPTEMTAQYFFDMAWDFSSFSYDNVNLYQAKWLAGIYGAKYQKAFQNILDDFYKLSWERKAEFMGYEIEWDAAKLTTLHDTNYSFESKNGKNSTAQQRLDECQTLSDNFQKLYESISPELQPSLFEMLGYAVKSFNQMNRKFLYAQQNHETGSQIAAANSQAAYDSINVLLKEYNTMLGGKWAEMMSQIPPGWVAKYQNMPELVSTPTDAYKLPADQMRKDLSNRIDLSKVDSASPFRLIEGLGTDWVSLQMGDPFDAQQDPTSLKSTHIDIPMPFSTEDDSVTVCVTLVPMWPVSSDVSNRIGVSLDGCTPKVCENKFREQSYEWKLQVLENRKDFILKFPVAHKDRRHTLTLIIGDPGQIVERISYE